MGLRQLAYSKENKVSYLGKKKKDFFLSSRIPALPGGLAGNSSTIRNFSALGLLIPL